MAKYLKGDIILPTEVKEYCSQNKAIFMGFGLYPTAQVRRWRKMSYYKHTFHQAVEVVQEKEIINLINK